MKSGRWIAIAMTAGWLVPGAGGSGCTCDRAPIPLAAPAADETVSVELTGVEARGYRGGRLLYAVAARTLRLWEQRGLIAASGAVRARLQPGLWEERR